jgi:chromosome segregation protein
LIIQNREEKSLNFRKLEVTGFKSFADKVEVVFEPGTTAIVGPNGCGKSNICDAIKWALGEQSARSLRCDKMENVIFNGGSTRRPLGMAQVSLTISNSNKILPVDYTEVEVSRRLFRSGESEYYLNRNRCLLKDIQEIFMDTGLGVNSYSIMEQGHIDLILNSTPHDRRLILEEAAGITKFRHRKKTALRKLEATERNLLRVNDILYELERQVSSLKRQASKARRYQGYLAELRELDTKLSLRKYGILLSESKAAQDRITDSDDKMRSISAAIKKLEAELEEHRLEITESEGKLADLRTQERKAQSNIEDAESSIAVLKERRTNLQQRQQQAITELGKLQDQLKDLEKQIAAVNVERGKLGESISSQESELKLAQEDADRLTEAAALAEKDAEELKSQAIDTLNRKSKAQNELSATDSRLDYLVTRLERLDSNAEGFRTEQTQLEDSVAKLQGEIEAREKEISDLNTKQKQVSSEMGKLQSRAALLEKNIRDIEQKRGAKASRLQSLQELQEAYEGYNAGVKAILGKSKGQKNAEAPLGGIRGVVAEIVRTKPLYETAVEASLGNSVQDIVTETMEDAKAAVEYLRDHKSGRATLLPLDVIAENSDTQALRKQASALHNVLALASQAVEFDEQYSPVVEYLLGNTMIVEDLDAAVELAGKSNGNHRPIRFATLDGQIVSSSGAVTGGTGSEGAGLLRRSREIGDLEKEVAELDEQLAGLHKDRDGLAAQVSSLQKEKEKIAGDLQTEQISHTSLKKDLSQCEQRMERLEKEISVVESERDALEKEVLTLEESKVQLAENTAKLEEENQEINRKIGVLQAEVRSKVQQRDAVIQQCTNVRVQLASKRQQDKGLADKLNSLEQDRDQLQKALSSRQTSASSDGETEKEIAGKIAAQEKILEELFRKRSQAESEVSKLDSQRQKAQVDLAQGEASLREHRRDLDQLNQGKYQLEVKKTELQMNINSLISKMRERYGVSLEELQSYADPDQKSEEDDAEKLSEDELTGRMEELRSRMDKMGSVNLTAVDEYNRQKERYDLLVAQKDDLLEGKDKLYKIIQRINRESRERLRETYESVNSSFKELFKSLFGGGHAELVMMGDEVLESGIDIVARPPGKKPQAISMLSSGERSLTAIAILFALFKIKPSPFCILDEVDAALDDANVGRFTDMVQEFSKDTQFVIITHNKSTMEMADVLYGITMEESGVSNLVSIRVSGRDKKVRQIAS